MSVLIYRPLRVCYYILGTTKTDISAFRYYDGGLIVRYTIRKVGSPRNYKRTNYRCRQSFCFLIIIFRAWKVDEFRFHYLLFLLSFSSSFLLTTRRRPTNRFWIKGFTTDFSEVYGLHIQISRKSRIDRLHEIKKRKWMEAYTFLITCFYILIKKLIIKSINFTEIRIQARYRKGFKK